MTNPNSIQRLAECLAERLGNNYEVYVTSPKIFVTIPDSDTDKELKFIEITKLLSGLNTEKVTGMYLKLQYLDEEERGTAPHRQIVDLLRRQVSGTIKIEYHINQIQISLPDDNANRFVEKSLLIMDTIQKLVLQNGIVIKEVISIRIKRSYRDLVFRLQIDNSTVLAQYGELCSLQLQILYKLCNSVLDKFYTIRASEYGVGDDVFSSDVQNLELKEFIEVNYDFNSLSGFVNAGEITEPEYPESFDVKLVNKDVVRKLHED